jgi:hypothetical protein
VWPAMPEPENLTRGLAWSGAMAMPTFTWDMLCPLDFVCGCFANDPATCCCRQVVVTNMINTESVIVRTATGPGGVSGPLRIDLQASTVAQLPAC